MTNLLFRIKYPLVALSLLLSVNSLAGELIKRTLCVWDIVGASGPTAAQLEDYRLKSITWGVDLKLKVYTDEKIASEELKAGNCDAATLTGLRTREFNSFTGTIDSLGAIPGDDHMRLVMQYMANPKLARLMLAGDFEVAGIMPGGSAYLFTNDKTIDTVEDLAGKKIGALDFDKAQENMIEWVGASPVSVSITTIGSRFNNGSVDLIALPALAYNSMELYKGMGENGSVINFTIMYFTMQTTIRPDRFPNGFGQQSRQYFQQRFEPDLDLVHKAEASIKRSYWLDLPTKDKEGYAELFRQSRLKLRDKGIYNGKMLSFLSRVRCQKEPALAECTAPDRE